MNLVVSMGLTIDAGRVDGALRVGVNGVTKRVFALNSVKNICFGGFGGHDFGSLLER